MKKYLIYILLLCIYNSILFYGKQLGISVLLFNIPLLIGLYYIYKKNDLLNNKKGLFFSIPIIILSMNYLLYDNEIFNLLNIPVISCLFVLMHLYTINPAFKLGDLFNKFFSLIFEPLTCISNIFGLLKPKDKKIKSNEKGKKVITSILIIIPIIFLILILLSSSDVIFGSIFTKLFKILAKIKISNTIFNLIGRLIIITILFFYISAVINYIMFQYKKVKEVTTNNTVDNFTIKLLLITLDIIYIVFDIIQIKSLMLHSISMDITYASYARRGFFQLMIVSLINLIIILISKKVKTENDKTITISSLIMIFLTLIIIISSFMRMCMYENAYGYTFLRLMIFITLITEVILLIPTILYILNKRHNIVVSYITILITAYSIINLLDINCIIARRNINRFEKSNKIDIYYLMNYSSDNYKLLENLYNETDNKKVKNSLEEYIKNVTFKTDGFQEFNISKYRANKK